MRPSERGRTPPTGKRRTNSVSSVRLTKKMIPLQPLRIAFFLTVLILSPDAVTSFSAAYGKRRNVVLSAVAPPEERLEADAACCRIVASSANKDGIVFQSQQQQQQQDDDRPDQEARKGEMDSVDRESDGLKITAAEQRQRSILAADLLRRSAHSSPPRTSSSSTNERVAMTRKQQPSQTKTKVTRSVIHSAIHELMEQAAHHQHNVQSSSLSSFVGKSIGVLGDQQDWMALKQRADLSKLTVLDGDDTVIRMASSLDDLEIANLRLSVFADFSLQQRSQFCARSCQAIAARRKRGASCLVAVSKGSTSSPPMVLGSAECSFHEFYGTQLGRRRKQHSILYVTEVAVSPSARRRGVGTNMLKAIDAVAKKRSIETLYLHVDVSNKGAIKLYEKAGYKRVANAPMFQEFTKSLNLHPGATKGRDHFLFFKNLVPSPVWLDSSVELQRHRSDERRILEVFGFEIPA